MALRIFRPATKSADFLPNFVCLFILPVDRLQDRAAKRRQIAKDAMVELDLTKLTAPDFVAAQRCLVCERQPCDPHHLRFARPRALGLKVSDEFTVSLCRDHHRQLHQAGNEVAWRHDLNIKPLEIVKGLWETSLTKGHSTAPAPQQ